MHRLIHLILFLSIGAFGFGFAPAAAEAAKKPNILVIWGDDIGMWNISANSRGMMGYKTPNIDRIAKEGLSFTDYYGGGLCRHFGHRGAEEAHAEALR